MSRYVYPAFPGEDAMSPNHQGSYPPTHPPYSPSNAQAGVPIYPPPNHRPLAAGPYPAQQQSPNSTVGLRQQLEQAIQLESAHRRPNPYVGRPRKLGKKEIPGQLTFAVNLGAHATGGAVEEDQDAEGIADGQDEDEGEGEEEVEEDNTPPEGMYYLAPPPQHIFNNYEECHAFMHDWNKMQGFDVSRQKPAKNKSGEIYKYLYQCTRHGRRGNNHKIIESERKRKRESKKTGCPMGVYIRAVDVKQPNGKWRVWHQQKGRSKFHNHEGVSPEELTGHRRRNRTDELKALIKQTRAAGMDAWQSLAYIKEKMPDALITKQDVLNYRKSDPGPESDTHNYLERPYILALSFESDFEKDTVYGQPLLTKLRSRLPISICQKPEALYSHIHRNPPKVILVTDSALTFPAYRLQLARLVTYTQDGGTIVFMGNFQATPPEYLSNMFLQHFNLDWHPVDMMQTPSSYSLNDKLEAGGSGGKWVVRAKGFAVGTDTKGIEQLVQLAPGSPTLLSCRMYVLHPTVTAELVFGSHEAAESVITAFSGKSVNVGRISTAEGKELEFILKPPAPMGTSELIGETFAKVNALRNVNVEDTVYSGQAMMETMPPQQQQYVNGQWHPGQPAQQTSVGTAAAAYAKLGKGFVGYVGFVDFDEDYVKLIAAMCHF